MTKPKSPAPQNITSMLQEERLFPPPAEFAKNARVKSMAQYKKLYRESIEDSERFWGKQANAELVWTKPWKEVLRWKAPNAKWFLGGQLNVSSNCLDRHLNTPTANKAALIWEGEPAGPGCVGEERVLTYQQLHREVCMFANVLKRNGVGKGDRVIIYLPMVPEAAIAMLACARIGAVHSVVFGGFSAQSVADRIFDCQAKLVITADGGYRRGSVVPLKKSVDEALLLKDATGALLAKTIEKVIVLRRACNEIHITEGRDVWWHRELEYVDANSPAAKMDSEAPLFILYTSGSTGKPKGILHTTGGYLLGAKMTTKYVFDIQETDVSW
jgi:acetyl-CoA synthetase